MSTVDEPFGARLYAELRQLSGYNVITGLLNYNAIQQLKQADRNTTLALFANSSYEVRQQICTSEPPEVARYLVEKATHAPDDGNALLIVMTALNCD